MSMCAMMVGWQDGCVMSETVMGSGPSLGLEVLCRIFYKQIIIWMERSTKGPNSVQRMRAGRKTDSQSAGVIGPRGPNGACGPTVPDARRDFL